MRSWENIIQWLALMPLDSSHPSVYASNAYCQVSGGMTAGTPFLSLSSCGGHNVMGGLKGSIHAKSAQLA